MSDPVIRVDGVSKRFRRGQSAESLRDVVAGLWNRRNRSTVTNKDDFWALDDVSFEVAAGEALGIIGANGAGKSTLLKLLAGILRPDRGTITTNGNISALIELGAGFHGELSGRENIYLNASILGMSRKQVTERFDSIVDFAEISDFLDTPVKRYSSGMHARLGFAIAAHADPNVLIVDEVLSVGDRSFRAKCMEKMRLFLDQGVAIVFVSHNLDAVQQFCRTAMVLERGKTSFIGQAGAAVEHYLDTCVASLLPADTGAEAAANVDNLQLLGEDGSEVRRCKPGDKIRVSFDATFHAALASPSYGLSLLGRDDQITMFETSSTRLDVIAEPVKIGDRQHVEYTFTANVLPGEYIVGLHIRDQHAAAYALFAVNVAGLIVAGAPRVGGVVHADPHVTIQRHSETASGLAESGRTKSRAECDSIAAFTG